MTSFTNILYVLISQCIFVPTQNPHVEILIPKVMVLEVGTFGRYIGNGDGALMNGIGALIKETPQTP